MSARFRVRGGRPLRGTTAVPGDKSIGHRALMFAALAEGPSTIEGLSGGLDNRATADAFRAMGVSITADDAITRVEGGGLFGLSMAPGAIDCGNSGTTMRLMTGLLVGQRFGTTLIGDASLSRRPMRRIIEPLRARGGHVAGVGGVKEGEMYSPIRVAPRLENEPLIALEYDSPVASAQVKSCLLLSGLYADGLTAIREPVLSRDHTERMMQALGIPIEAMGPMMVLDPSGWARRWDGFDWTVPGDLSSAAFVIAAALLVPKSEVTITGVGVNPTRTGLCDVLRAMRAGLAFLPKGEAAGNEPVADLTVRHAGALAAATTGGELLTRMIDEVPAFAAVATGAGGRSAVRDAAELRVKESDRIAMSARALAAFGADVTEIDDGLLVHGGARLHGAELASGDDHRIAMMGAVLGMAAEGETVIHDVECVDTSFPGFVETFAALGADIVREG